MTAATKPTISIRPNAGWQAINLREIWQFRDLLTTLADRDVKLRYRQTSIGVAWVVLQPLMAAAILAFVFGRVAKLPSDGIPYFPFVFAGLLAWNAFNSTLTKSSNSLVQNSQLVSKVYFPRVILPLSTVFSTLIDFLVSFAVMLSLLVHYGIHPNIGILLLPVWFLLIVLLAIGVGLFAAALMVTYRDIQYILPVVVPFLMYLSPVAYTVALVPPRWQVVFMLNPIASFLEAFRWSLLGHGHLIPWALVYSTVVTVVIFCGGVLAFKKRERKFADVI